MKIARLGEAALLDTEPVFQACIALNVGVESERRHAVLMLDEIGVKMTFSSGGISFAETVDILARSDI